MCLLLIAHQTCPGYPLVVAANRDEFHNRPAHAADFWSDYPHILGGRDAQANGTWLAIDKQGRLATITNISRGLDVGNTPPSRGLIVSDFLNGDTAANHFVTELADVGHLYQGFNVIARDHENLCWYSNDVQRPETLQPGIYTLSNASLHTAWPKTEALREGFARAKFRDPEDAIESLLDILHPHDDKTVATSDLHASIFINGNQYGTRCSTVVLIDDSGSATFHERRFDSSGGITGESRFTFELQAPAG